MTFGCCSWKPRLVHRERIRERSRVLEWQQSSETPTHTSCISCRTPLLPSCSNAQRETGTETVLQKLHLPFRFPEEAKDAKASAKLPENRSGQMQSLVQDIPELLGGVAEGRMTLHPTPQCFSHFSSLIQCQEQDCLPNRHQPESMSSSIINHKQDLGDALD